MLALIDVSWYLSGGYRGSNGFFLFLLLIISLLISKKNHHFIIASLAVFNAISLYLIEFNHPHLAVRIPFEIDILTQCLIIVVCIITASIIVVKIKNNYDNDRARILELNNLLSAQKSEIERKNKELESYSHKLKDEVEQQTRQLELLNKDLREQNISHEQFTYILAHNIKSPVTQLRGLFSILPKDITNDDTARETLDRMDDSINKLGNVIHDLSKIVNLRKDNTDLFEEVFILRQLNIALNTLDEQINSSNAEIDISDVIDVSILGIKAYMQSILYNLIHNAIKYSAKDRRPQIKISVRQCATYVEIAVSDNGIGIDLKQAKGKIFQLYQRFNDDRPGKGFGLFLIKTQLKAMGGEINAESEVGVGTTFTIKIST